MKQIALALLAITLLPTAALAADAAFKIGYVDMQGALNSVEEGKREKGKLKKDFDVKQKKLDGMQEDLKKLKENFDKQSTTLTEEARGRKQAELQSKFMELQQHYMQMQKELSEKEGAVTREIFGKMKTIIDKIGDRDSYTLILERNEGNVLYFKKHMDITDEVVKIYNGQHK